MFNLYLPKVVYKGDISHIRGEILGSRRDLQEVFQKIKGRQSIKDIYFWDILDARKSKNNHDITEFVLRGTLLSSHYKKKTVKIKNYEIKVFGNETNLIEDINIPNDFIFLKKNEKNFSQSIWIIGGVFLVTLFYILKRKFKSKEKKELFFKKQVRTRADYELLLDNLQKIDEGHSKQSIITLKEKIFELSFKKEWGNKEFEILSPLLIMARDE